METRGLKDLFLPQQLAVHAKILLFCLLFTPIWGLIIKAELNSIFLIGTFSIMLVDIEILIWLGGKIHHERIPLEDLKKKYIMGLGLFYLAAIVICTLTFALFIIVLHVAKGWDIPNFFMDPMRHQMLEVIKVTGIGLSLSIPIFFYGQWQSALKREQKLREQNLIFQNETLKNQVNPHFLFNSLNTLSSLIVTQTEIAESFVSRLASIYRYILENSPKDTIPLKEELAFLEAYFFLHKIRDNGKIQLHVDFPNPDNYLILPVSLQMLLENAIKHNMATRDLPLIINVYKEESFVVVKNNVQKMASKLESTKKGQKNLSERMKGITGKELVIEETKTNYVVKVPLLNKS